MHELIDSISQDVHIYCQNSSDSSVLELLGSFSTDSQIREFVYSSLSLYWSGWVEVFDLNDDTDLSMPLIDYWLDK